jgi:hypothetical protein
MPEKKRAKVTHCHERDSVCGRLLHAFLNELGQLDRALCPVTETGSRFLGERGSGNRQKGRNQAARRSFQHLQDVSVAPSQAQVDDVRTW